MRASLCYIDVVAALRWFFFFNFVPFFSFFVRGGGSFSLACFLLSLCLCCRLPPPIFFRGEGGSCALFDLSRALLSLCSLFFPCSLTTPSPSRAQVAALSVLGHHVFLQGAFCHSELAYGEAATRVLGTALSHYPNGGIFLMFRGRQSRLEKNCVLARQLRPFVLDHFSFSRISHSCPPSTTHPV